MNYNDKEYVTSERITRWVERVEQQVEELLAKKKPEEIGELSAKDRLALATKYLALLQRFLLLAQKSEAATPDNSAQQELVKIRESMRGELSPA
ncbi:MAG TPA: hypothetical protein VL485_24130 [Ktedonobacteraceae bacterium]|jgi:hypothetical protein|nr:hypothetical protein [Ktedonobacteraceae bacterium]